MARRRPEPKKSPKPEAKHNNVLSSYLALSKPEKERVLGKAQDTIRKNFGVMWVGLKSTTRTKLRNHLILAIHGGEGERVSQILDAIENEIAGEKTRFGNENPITDQLRKEMRRHDPRRTISPAFGKKVSQIRRNGFGKKFDSNKILSAIDSMTCGLVPKHKNILVVWMLAKHGPLTATQLREQIKNDFGDDFTQRYFLQPGNVNDCCVGLTTAKIIVRRGEWGMFIHPQYVKKAAGKKQPAGAAGGKPTRRRA